jgi:acyl-CoA thioester hydrolase
MHDSLNQFKSIIEIPIAWGDMDAAQHVNNTKYLKYGESSRIKYMQDIGYLFDLTGKAVILAEMNCKYKFPLTFLDTIWVGTRAIIDKIEEYSFWAEQIIVSQKHQRISAVILTKLVSYDFINLCKLPISEDQKQMIIKFENRRI